MRRFVFGVLVGAMPMVCFAAGDAPTFAAYQPEAILEGRLALAGAEAMGPLMQDLADRFRQFHPRVELTDDPSGPPRAPGGLAEGSVEIGFTGRTLRPGEVDEIRARQGAQPQSIVFALGAYSDATATETMVVIVHEKNPLRAIRLPQVCGVFSTGEISTWGQLGLNAGWSREGIRPFVGKLGTGATDFVREHIPGFEHWHSAAKEFTSDSDVVNALSEDVHAIAIVGLSSLRPVVRALPLVDCADTEIYPTRANVAAANYPLTRRLYLHLNEKVAGTMCDRLRWEFVRFVLSAEGQAVVARSRYLPLPPAMARDELSRVRQP